jgi:hypothetical protein
MKRNLEASFLFRSASIFYPHGVPSNPELLDPSIGRDTVRQLERETRRYVAALEQYHRARRDRIGQFNPRATAQPLPEVRLIVVETGQPISRAELNGDITLDVTVLQAAFRSSLISGIRNASEPSVSEPTLSPLPNRHGNATEAELLAEFLDLVKNIREAPCHTLVGDLASAVSSDSLDSPWFKFVEFAEQSERIDRAYRGTVLFLVAHELGHLALRHPPITEVTESECARFDAQELEADCYAAFLLSDLFRATAVSSLFALGGEDHHTGLSSYMGGNDFFEVMYSLAGFDRPASAKSCLYPAKATRLAAVNGVADRVAAEVATEVEQKLDEQFRKAFEDRKGRDE